jgi:hypothetical protein
MATGDLRIPWAVAPSAADGPRIETRPIDVETVVVRLFASKPRTFDDHPVGLDARRHHAGRDVRRVHVVMGQRRLRIVTRRVAMHERRRAEGGCAYKVRRQRVSDGSAFKAVGRAQSHEEIVRVLAIDQGRPVIGLAGLKDLRRADLFQCERLERHHALEGQPAGFERPLAGQHEPVLRFPGREVGELAPLIVVAEER